MDLMRRHIKAFKINIRYERLASTFPVFIQVTCIIIYLRVYNEFYHIISNP
ncbi:MAG: hypothetical protein QXY40_03050 [Candidatus Methanomethylicia archaeon]